MPSWRWWVLLGALLLAVLLGLGDQPLASLLPPAVALLVIILFRQALWGLLAGGLSGAVVLAGGNPLVATVQLLPEHLFPGFSSPWKLGALAFTLILGGFAAILEDSGGFNRLLGRISRGKGQPGVRLEAAAGMLGLLCFFDGLANSMVVGRVSRRLADKTGVTRVKLAYIADSTSSAVACVAVISTWIAFQLSMIQEAFAAAGHQVNPYAVFLSSLPLNFYCWFTLVMLAVAIFQQFHPGPMASFSPGKPSLASGLASGPVKGPEPDGPVAAALLPLAVLIISFLAGFVVLGSEGQVFPLTRDRLVAAFGSDAGPLVMVLASLVASVFATLVFPGKGISRFARAGKAFMRGVAAMIPPAFILMAAWILGSVIGQLGTADLITRLAGSSGSLSWMPTLVFLTGALVSFSTGTSWGTMGLLFPLAIPAAATLGAAEDQLVLLVAAVFSGAVFGDHCSPFSDTTIVTSISCGVEPHDHVRTQLPYALLTAVVAVVFGFIPAGFGFPPWISLLAGVAVLLALPRVWKWSTNTRRR